MREFDNNFISAYDFAQAINRGGEVEFIYGDKEYSVTRPDGRTVFVCEADNADSEIGYTNPIDALSYPIGDKRLGDILGDMKVTFRSL